MLTADLRIELEEEKEDVDAVCAGVVHDDAGPAALDLRDLLHTGYRGNTEA